MRDKHAAYITIFAYIPGVSGESEFLIVSCKKNRKYFQVLLSYDAGKIKFFIYLRILPSIMKTQENNEDKSSVKTSNTLDYTIKPMSVKLTPKIESMLNYIADQTQMSRSNIVRYSITELYRKIKTEKEIINKEEYK